VNAYLLSNGATGNVRQALALIEALQRQPVRVDVHLRGFDALLAPRWKSAQLARLPLPGQIYVGAQVAVACGRAGAAALAALKQANPALIGIQILDPRIDPKHFDAVICPRHDQLAGANVIHIDGGLHGFSPAFFATLAAPSAAATLILLGAASTNARYTEADFRALLATHSQNNAALRLSASRRSNSAWVAHGKRLGIEVFDPNAAQGGRNPYLAWLAESGRIIVTPDSVNMISEACATVAHVQVAWQNQTRGKIRRFLDNIAPRLHGHADEAIAWAGAPLVPMPGVLARLRTLLPALFAPAR
jgi:uncharacterized protein